MAQSLVRRSIGEFVRATTELEQSVGHFRREEAGSDAIDQNPLGSQVEGEVPREVQHGRFGSAVAVGGLFTQRSHADTRDGARDNDTRGIFERGTFAEEGCESGKPFKSISSQLSCRHQPAIGKK